MRSILAALPLLLAQPTSAQDGPSRISAAVNAPAQPEVPRPELEGAVSGSAIMPDKLSAKGVIAIACAEPFDGCKTKFQERAGAIGPVATFAVPLKGQGRFFVFAWKDSDGDGQLSMGDYIGVGRNGEAVSRVANVGDFHMKIVGPKDL